MRRADANLSVGAKHATSFWRSRSSATQRSALQERGARHIAAPFPLGSEGTTDWLQRRRGCVSRFAGAFRGGHGPAALTGRGFGRTATQSPRRQAHLLFPDSQLEIPLARFLARELGMVPVEVGTPYLNRALMAAELALLPPGLCSARVRTSIGNSTAAAMRPPIWSCVAWASPIRSRRRASRRSGRSNSCSRRSKATNNLAISPSLFARPLMRRQRLEV